MTALISCLGACSNIPSASPQLFLAGDSTMSIKEENRRPETGWGEKLREKFRPPLSIHNHAKNGRSSKSFINEGNWNQILLQLKPGDFVFIQFGHNDQKEGDPNRYTNPYSSYREYLRQYVDDTRSHHATPVLISSIVRRSFNDAGSLIDTHGPYPMVMRDLARELSVDFIDLNMLTERLITSLGAERSKEYYLHVSPRHKNYHEGISDNTHLSPYGAEEIATLVIVELCRINHPLKEYINTCR